MGIALGDVLMSRYPRPRRFGYHNNCGGEGMFQAPCGAWDCEDCNPDDNARRKYKRVVIFLYLSQLFL